MSAPGDTTPAARYAHAVRLFEQGKLVEVRAEFVALAAFDEFHERSCNALVQIDLQLNRLDDVRKTLAALCERYPQELSYLASASGMASGVETQLTAVEKLQHFQQQNPNNAEVHFHIAQGLRRLGERREAIVHFHSALDLRIAEPDASLVACALAHADLGEHKQALKLLDQALRIDAGSYAALFNRASLLEEAGDAELAAEAYRAVLQRYPDSVLAQTRLAQLLPASPDLLEGLSELAAKPGLSQADSVALEFAQGQIADELGDYAVAWEHFRQANSLQAAEYPAYDNKALEARVESTLQRYNAAWFEQHGLGREERPAFVCGMFRSGSTLLEHMLATQSGLQSGGELDYFIHAAARCAGQIEAGDRQTLEALASEYVQLLESFEDSAATTTRINKRPDNILHIPLIKTLFPQARILITRRALADNCLSVFSHPLGAGMSYATRLADVAHYYRQILRLAEHWVSTFPETVAIVEYEQLVTEPATALEGALRVFEMTLEPGFEQFHKQRNPARTASVWQIRQPLHANAVDRAANYAPWLAGELGE